MQKIESGSQVLAGYSYEICADSRTREVSVLHSNIATLYDGF